ncbi:hypothetical protein [Flavobacterium sp. CAU 1735]|uniref:hypothetical protein n=1 Tax=Flavobacterium sp. CAU 1735 TaxID=3140361 RepID=UPI0032610B7E
MKRLYFAISLFLFSGVVLHPVFAQPNKGEFINASVGLGIVSPYDTETSMNGTGFYAQGEYVWCPRSWFGVIPYAGVVIASAESEEKDANQEVYSLKANAALLGTKIRLAAPIPYVAPFIEVGVGVSVGSFYTYTKEDYYRKNGLLMHVPFSLGLALGRKHNVEVKFAYYYHESVRQTSGAAAIGISFPLED